MTAKYLSLLDLVKLQGDEAVSEKYVRYIAGFSSKKRYRHDEIIAISHLAEFGGLTEIDCVCFLYGYEIPQLNKEFDLLKIFGNSVLNIELKSQKKSDAELIKQLKQNAHYLRLVKGKVDSYVFVDSPERVLYRLEGDSLVKADPSELSWFSVFDNPECLDLDEEFRPSRILVSPLNDTERFLNDEYLLTENQSNIENKVLSRIGKIEDGAFFYGIKGNPGTGKTLLLYDIAKKLSKQGQVLLVHCGKLCKGHLTLNESMLNFKVIEAKDLRYHSIKEASYILVDETHRLYGTSFDEIIRWTKRTKTICVFSYDEKQRLSYSENNRDIPSKIEEICGENISKLTTKIRTNKEIALFVTCLFDLSKFDGRSAFANVKIVYEPDRAKAIEKAKSLPEHQYISYTPSVFYARLSDQESDLNTHRVIGQEFDKVVMILDGNFHYEANKLAWASHPNPDYIFGKLLYQGLTRARHAITLIVTEASILLPLLSLFPPTE